MDFFVFVCNAPMFCLQKKVSSTRIEKSINYGRSKRAVPEETTMAGAHEEELWNGTWKTDPKVVCGSYFDPTYSIEGKHGHSYGIGNYFAAHAIYSNWFAAYRVPGTRHRQLILASVVLGKCKDFGRGLSHKLCREPPGCDSWGGTENDMDIPFVNGRIQRGDEIAKRLKKTIERRDRGPQVAVAARGLRTGNREPDRRDDRRAHPGSNDL